MNHPYLLTPNRIKVLDILHKEGGEIHDKDGLATSHLMTQSGHNTTNALSGMLMAMENDRLITRDTAGRRTYSIRLTSLGKQVVDEQASPTPVEPVAVAKTPASRRPTTIDILQAEIQRLHGELKIERERNDRLIDVIGRLAQSAA